MKIDKLTINERLIPDEHSTNGGDPILKGGNLTAQQHTLVTEQPVKEHILDPPDSSTYCEDSAALRPRAIKSNVDINDHLQSSNSSQSSIEAVDQHHAILREARANKMISPGGITDLRTRPPSPTNLCDFP